MGIFRRFRAEHAVGVRRSTGPDDRAIRRRRNGQQSGGRQQGGRQESNRDQKPRGGLHSRVATGHESTRLEGDTPGISQRGWFTRRIVTIAARCQPSVGDRLCTAGCREQGERTASPGQGELLNTQGRACLMTSFPSRVTLYSTSMANSSSSFDFLYSFAKRE